MHHFSGEIYCDLTELFLIQKKINFDLAAQIQAEKFLNRLRQIKIYPHEKKELQKGIHKIIQVINNSFQHLTYAS